MMQQAPTQRFPTDDKSITWHFNPPNAPHFGGLWESGVKSAKIHLKKVIGEQVLSIEEMSTLLRQIEVCMNSWPIQPMSADPNDLLALTLANILNGRLLVSSNYGAILDSSYYSTILEKMVNILFTHFAQANGVLSNYFLRRAI